MKIIILFQYPIEPTGGSLQGYYLMKGLRELGHEVIPCDPENNMQKEWLYAVFKPDVVIGIGFWGDTPDLILDPLNHGLKPVPWLNADGWIANYHKILSDLPLLAVTSNWVKKTYIRDGVKGDNIYHVSIGYDPDVFYPMQKNDTSIMKLREMIGVKPDELMLLTMGGDVTSKGAQEMLRALAKIDKDFPKWKYVLKLWDQSDFSAENHGKEEKALIEQLGIDKEKIIYLHGKFAPEFMAKLINACDIYAAPSRLEGFGMIQLEAQACGKPVISINAGGPVDTIIHNVTGFLADVAEEIKLEKEWVYQSMGFETEHQIEFEEPKTFAYKANINQLADYTLKLFTDKELREKMGKAAAKHALEKFHYKTTAKQMAELIEKYVINTEKIKFA